MHALDDHQYNVASLCDRSARAMVLGNIRIYHSNNLTPDPRLILDERGCVYHWRSLGSGNVSRIVFAR